MEITKEIKQLIKNAFAEDAPQGDITSQFFIDHKLETTAKIIAKEDGILAGIDLAQACFKHIDKNIVFEKDTVDGYHIKKGDVIAKISGKARNILLAERTALNFLQFLSGIATKTNNFLEKVKETKVKILDTRKTLPGYRALSKYAVRCGGGTNHRFGLSDMVLVKENHLDDLTEQGIAKRIAKIKAKTKGIKVELEAETIEQVELFLSFPIDVIMLDNMTAATMKKAVKLRDDINPEIMLEASGNMTEKTVGPVAKTGVDFISVGSLTHSVKAFDFSLIIS